MRRAVASSDEKLLRQRHDFVWNMPAETDLSVRQRDAAAFLVLGVSRDDTALRLGIRTATLSSHLVCTAGRYRCARPASDFLSDCA